MTWNEQTELSLFVSKTLVSNIVSKYLHGENNATCTFFTTMIRGPFHNNRKQNLEARAVYIKTARVVYIKNKVHFFQ